MDFKSSRTMNIIVSQADFEPLKMEAAPVVWKKPHFRLK